MILPFMKRLYFSWILLLAALASCNNTQEQPCPEEDLLYEWECTLAKRPSEVYRALDTINPEVLSKKELAHYCLLKVTRNDARFDYSDQTDSLLQIAKQYYVGSKDYYFEAKTCEAVARVGFKRGMSLDYKLEWEIKAFQSIEKCQHLDERIVQCLPENTSEQDFINECKYKLLWRLGLDYSMGEYFDKALDCFKQAYQYFDTRRNSAMWIRSTYTLGYTYQQLHEYDSCFKYLNLSLQNAQQSGITEEIVQSHYALSGYYQSLVQNTDDKDEEIRLLRQSNQEIFKGLELLGESPRIKDYLYLTLSKNYLLLGQPDSCVFCGEKSLEFIKILYGKVVPNDAYAEAYHRLYQAYDTLGNPEKALQYAKLYLEMKDELSDEATNLEHIKGDYEKQLEVQRLESEQQVKRYQLYLLLSLLLLALVVVIWINFRYRKNKEIEDLKFQEEFQRMQTSFEQNTQHSKNLLIKRVTDIYRSNAENPLEQILHEFELQYPKALDKISEAYPDLTKAEKHIVILSFLDFRAKEEADLLHLSENTVMKYRSNIKKKVDENLYMLFL